MAANGWGTDFTKLEQYYFDRLTAATQEITQNQMRYIVWQERLYSFHVEIFIHFLMSFPLPVSPRPQHYSTDGHHRRSMERS
jgi:hypothetical protein